MNPVRLYYWRGHGPIGSVVRHASSSQWNHMAVSCEIDGLPCYLESILGPGFRAVPVQGDELPHAIQETGLEWEPGKLAESLLKLSRRRYSIWNGILAAFGIRRKSDSIECAQAAAEILTILGLPMDPVPEPQQVANEIERRTGNPVRMAR